MRHRNDTVKLGRTSSHRNAMFRNMVTSLFKHDRIQTTDIKAKELRRWADEMITLAKRGDLHARRMALSVIRERDVVQKLFAEATQRYGSISGGYTRIVKVGRRPGDASTVSIIELVASQVETKKNEKQPKKTADAAKVEAGAKAQDKASANVKAGIEALSDATSSEETKEA